MSAQVDAVRRDCAISVLGGPTTVIDIAGRRIVMDPTFDPPGVHDYLTKLTGPAVNAAALGPVDAVLVSHDQHPDNLDDDGRRLALSAALVLTHPGAAGRRGRRRVVRIETKVEPRDTAGYSAHSVRKGRRDEFHISNFDRV